VLVEDCRPTVRPPDEFAGPSRIDTWRFPCLIPVNPAPKRFVGRTRREAHVTVVREADTDPVGGRRGGRPVTFQLRDHTADVAVEAESATLSGVFAAVADGLTAAMCDDVPSPADGDESVSFTVEAESREALLFDYLDQLIYERDVRGVLPADNEAVVSSSDSDARGTWRVEGRARGVPFSRVDAREVKAVTYSEMRLEETDAGWEAYVVFDV
jgi:SHS2 domain-containing protein